MAKSIGMSSKITTGKKKTGMAKRHYGPKESKPKKYRGQGRK